MSPRKLDLVGVVGITKILTEAGKVNRKTGKPFTIGWVSRLTREEPSFPKPWIEESARRLWRRADVLKWLPTYDQRDGPRPQKAQLLVAALDSQPDRGWSVSELTAEVRKDRIFAGVHADVVQELAGRMTQQHRIKRVRRGVYQSLHSNGREG